MAVSRRETILRRLRSRWRALVCVGFLVVALGAALGLRAEEPRFFRIGTAATAGSYFEIGGVIASAISKPADSPDCERGGSCGVSGLVAVAQATPGSVENLRLVNSGQIESGFAQSDLAGSAYRGQGIFAGEAPMEHLRAIANLFPEALHLVVAANSEIHSFTDLKGRRVSLGEQRSGTLVSARLVLAAAGVAETDMRVEYLRPAQASQEIKDGTLDAFFLVGGYPVPAIRELAVALPIRLIQVDDALLRRVRDQYGHYGATVIPAGSYPGLGEDTASIGFHALWVVSADQQPDLIYDVTKALWNEATGRLIDARIAIGKRIRFDDALTGLTVPLHPGAERFYHEAGMASDAPIARN